MQCQFVRQRHRLSNASNQRRWFQLFCVSKIDTNEFHCKWLAIIFLLSDIFNCNFRKSKCNADNELNRVFKILSSQENDIVRPRIITHLGRDLKFEKTCGQVLFSTFDDLCDQVRIICVIFGVHRFNVGTCFNIYF